MARRNFALAALSFALTLAAAELAARYFAPPAINGGEPFYVPHPHLIYTGNPASRYWHNREGFGDRRHALEKTEGSIRIACVGGSTTYGKTNWPQRVEKQLREQFQSQRDVEVLNFGMQGYTSLESLINVAINVLDYDPDYLVIHHALNDLMPRLYPSMERDYGHFRKPFERTGPVSQFLFRHSALFKAIARRVGAGGSLAHVTMTVHDANPDNPFSPDTLNPDASIFQRNLETMISIATGAGIQPVLTTMPHSLDPEKLPQQWAISFDTKVRGMNEHNEIIRALAQRRTLPLVDLDRQMTGVEEVFVDHVHCSDEGRDWKARLIAQQLAESVGGAGR